VRDGLVRSLSQPLAAAGFDLEDVTVTKAGSRSVVRVVIDRDGGVDLDAVADASQLVSAELDVGDGPLPGAYVLEVTSPGVDRPLTAPRHWRRAVGRLVAVRTRDGRRLVARLTDADETSAEIVPQPASGGGGRGKPSVGDVGPRRVAYADVAHAVIEIEFSRTEAEPVIDDIDVADGADGADGAVADIRDDGADDDVEGTEQ
jgi:ribosome maturation factor RimP